MLRRLGILLLIGLAIAGAAAADDSLRCGTGLVTLDMVMDQVLAKCGEPQSKSTEEVPVKARARTGAVNTVGTTRIERWTYDRGYGQLPALLTFEHGKLKSIELLAHR
jgi:uncharacterized protein DUF2845